MKYFIPFVLCLFLFIGCKDKQASSADRIIDNDTVHYFQLKEFFESELSDIAKTPYFIYKITAEGPKQDSVSISDTDLIALAKPFLQPDINDKAIKKYYQESVFHDQTIKTYTISYTATKNTLELQSADIIFQEDAKTVTRIFIRKFFEKDGKRIREQLTWKPNQSFQIIHSEQTADSPVEQTAQTLVVWNSNN